jgi:hypothetical protein
MIINVRKALLLSAAFTFAACGGGGGTMTAPPSAPSALATTSPAAALVTPQFTIRIPAPTTSSAKRTPQFVSGNANLVTITHNTVNGGAPPVGLTTSISTAITPGSCTTGCTVNGPASPPGTDNYSVSTFAGPVGNETLIGTASQSFSIIAGSANTNLSITLSGIPATLSVSTPTAGTANSTGTQPITVAAMDASGATILGVYSQSVTLTDSDASGAQGSQLSLTPGVGSTSTPVSGASTVVITNSDDVVQLVYGGLAILSPTLHATATGSLASPNVTFTVNLNLITASTAEIDLFSSLGSGTGSTGPVTFAELGYSNTPYNKTFSVSAPVGCSNFVTVSPASGATLFTVSAIASPNAGTCTVTGADTVGQTKGVTVTYTTASFGVK